MLQFLLQFYLVYHSFLITFQIYIFCIFCYFIELSMVWKYNSKRSINVLFLILYIFWFRNSKFIYSNIYRYIYIYIYIYIYKIKICGYYDVQIKSAVEIYKHLWCHLSTFRRFAHLSYMFKTNEGFREK